MSFSSFSKDFTANMYTSVENQFITKYLPQADGDAVRAYLYGLYLCSCKEEFDAAHAAALLKIPLDRLIDIFGFWEDCDLVRILSREPLYIEYLPVNAAVGTPKPIRPEKYAQFNREFYKLLHKAGKDFKPYEMGRILEFLENNPMEQQAFLLVAEYCARKDGEKLSCAHILGKANKLCKDHKYTYDQVEESFNSFNAHEKELSQLFTLLALRKTPDESDYAYLEKWREAGAEWGAVVAAAKSLKKGTLATLGLVIEELAENNALTKSAAEEYLARREELISLTFKVARKLGLKIQNPRPYAEEYARKWTERGYDEAELLPLAGVALKMGFGFEELNALIDRLYREGIVDEAGVKAYCERREKELKLLQKIQAECGVIRKTQSVIDMIATWQSWNFSESMILEAARLSATASYPVAYINKLLSEWKRLGVYAPSDIPKAAPKTTEKDFRSEAAIAADKRSDRESYYAALRQSALTKAEKKKRLAESDAEFSNAEAAIRKDEIALAKAEVYKPECAPMIRERIRSAKKQRAAALERLHLTEEDFLPVFTCKKCSDTGYLPDGTPCDCH